MQTKETLSTLSQRESHKHWYKSGLEKDFKFNYQRNKPLL